MEAGDDENCSIQWMSDPARVLSCSMKGSEPQTQGRRGGMLGKVDRQCGTGVRSPDAGTIMFGIQF